MGLLLKLRAAYLEAVAGTDLRPCGDPAKAEYQRGPGLAGQDCHLGTGSQPATGGRVQPNPAQNHQSNET